MPSDDKFTLEYYAEQARLCGSKWSSTMQDEVVRSREVAFIRGAIARSWAMSGKSDLKILDLGCGNGWTTEVICEMFPKASFWAVDFCEDLLDIAKKRPIPNCVFSKGDARSLQFEDGFFDVVYTERCLINIRDWEEQKKALSEVARVLQPSGCYSMIECFTDGHLNYNKAREEMGLNEIPFPSVNLFFDKGLTMLEMEKYFTRCSGGLEFNFLSSHYFVARVIHPCVQHKEVRNSEFVKFFSEALPNVGNYSPIQGFLWQKKQ